jgi:proteic killer suppression protein
LEILFRTRQLEEECNRPGKDQRGKVLRRRLDDLRAAPNLDAMRNLPGHCHELKRDLRGLLAVRLDGGFRLCFRPADEPPPRKEDGGLDWKRVTMIIVERIDDYHD